MKGVPLSKRNRAYKRKANGDFTGSGRKRRSQSGNLRQTHGKPFKKASGDLGSFTIGPVLATVCGRHLGHDGLRERRSPVFAPAAPIWGYFLRCNGTILGLFRRDFVRNYAPAATAYNTPARRSHSLYKAKTSRRNRFLRSSAVSVVSVYSFRPGRPGHYTASPQSKFLSLYLRRAAPNSPKSRITAIKMITKDVVFIGACVLLRYV